jgi:hypothetical protein
MKLTSRTRRTATPNQIRHLDTAELAVARGGDFASGMPTGKRQHTPVVLSAEGDELA